jgi:hypothetical protein
MVLRCIAKLPYYLFAFYDNVSAKLQGVQLSPPSLSPVLSGSV